jgi:hypothetical protein
VCGDLAEVERILASEPQAASVKGGGRRWEPLLYLCCARLPIAAARDSAVAIAAALLDHGADPNVSMTDGENPFTAITGAIGEGERTPAQVPPHPQAEALVRLLIERGADPFEQSCAIGRCCFSCPRMTRIARWKSSSCCSHTAPIPAA